MKTVVVFFVLLVLFVIPVSAFAPDYDELSLLMQKNYGALTSWEAEVTFPKYPGTSVHVWFARGQWRQEWKAGDTAKAVGNGGSVVAKCTAGKFALSPLFVWMPMNPVQSWKSWGVDAAVRNFGFCSDTPCLLIGAEPGDETTSVVQLNNEDYSPLLVRYTSEVGLTTVKYSEYRTFGGFQVPQKVLVSVGEVSLDTQVKWIAVNRAGDEELYERAAVDLTPCAMPPAPFDIVRDSFFYPSAK